MNRRQYLGTAAATLSATAGCLDVLRSARPDTVEYRRHDVPDDLVDASAAPSGGWERRIERRESAESTVPDDADVRVTSADLVVRDDRAVEDAAIHATVASTTESLLHRTRFEATFYDADGGVVGTTPGLVYDLAPDETWEAWFPAPGVDGPPVADATLEFDAASRRDGPLTSSNTDVLDYAIRQGDGIAANGYAVEGRAKNTGDEAWLSRGAVAKLYAENGNVVASGEDVSRKVPSGEEWTFSVLLPFGNDDWAARVDAYEFVVVE